MSEIDLSQINILEVEKEIYRRSLKEFMVAAWPIIEPGKEFIDNWHIDEMCRHMEAIYEHRLTRLVVNVPPGSCKTLTLCVFFPAWVWAKSPTSKMLFVSYSDRLSRKAHIKFRTLIESKWYKERWGDVFSKSEHAWQNTILQNDKMGERVCASMTGSITGTHYDHVVIDDPIKPKDTVGASGASKKKLEECIDLYTQTISNRLSDKKRSTITIIAQRLHDEDLPGYALKTGVYELMCLPWFYQKGSYTKNVLGVYDHRTKNKEKLWEAAYPDEYIKSQQHDLGPNGFSAQFQQDPVAKEGGLFNRSWIKFYTELPAKRGQIVHSWDMSFKKSDQADYCVGQVWLKVDNSYYLLDQVRDKMDFSDAKKSVISLACKKEYSRYSHIYIEETANGAAVISALKDEAKLSGIVPVKQPAAEKVSRANVITGLWEAGNVFLPNPIIAPWIHDFIEEIMRFPHTKHDDQIDAMSQALTLMRRRDFSAIAQGINNRMRRWLS